MTAGWKKSSAAMPSAHRSPMLKWHGAPQCVPECSPIVILFSLKPSFSTVKSVSSSKSGSPGKIGIPTVFTWLRKTTLLNPNGPLAGFRWAEAECESPPASANPAPAATAATDVSTTTRVIHLMRASSSRGWRRSTRPEGRGSTPAALGEVAWNHDVDSGPGPGRDVVLLVRLGDSSVRVDLDRDLAGDPLELCRALLGRTGCETVRKHH